MTANTTFSITMAFAALVVFSTPASASEKSESCANASLSSVQSTELRVKDDLYGSWTIYQRRQFEDAALDAKRIHVDKPPFTDLALKVSAAKIRRADDLAMADDLLAQAKAAPAGREGSEIRSEAYASRSLWLEIRKVDGQIINYARCYSAKPFSH